MADILAKALQVNNIPLNTGHKNFVTKLGLITPSSINIDISYYADSLLIVSSLHNSPDRRHKKTLEMHIRFIS